MAAWTTMGAPCAFSPAAHHRNPPTCLLARPSVTLVLPLSRLSSSILPPFSPAHHRVESKRTSASKGPAVVLMSLEAGIGVMGTKLGMMTYFEPEGTVVPVTVVGFREGNIVTQVKTASTHGYDAVQVGYRRVRDRKLTRPELGHLAKAGAIPMRHLQEFRLSSVESFEPGQRLILEDIFKEGDLVDVSGNSIGKGFQGFPPLLTAAAAALRPVYYSSASVAYGLMRNLTQFVSHNVIYLYWNLCFRTFENLGALKVLSLVVKLVLGQSPWGNSDTTNC